MKIRAVTVGVVILPSDFDNRGELLRQKFSVCRDIHQKIINEAKASRYEVSTMTRTVQLVSDILMYNAINLIRILW